jgi:hypothetical protein
VDAVCDGVNGFSINLVFVTSRVVADLNPDEVIQFFFFPVYLILPAALWLWGQLGLLQK